ncbi:hypothetical protein [Streptosporangium sp. CA-115845]|uniref:hypothetical protein n=1 Tax=Streptosporangium sp. CA-115845 TaxID=3240071 RepID=UPI003D8EB78F
MNEPPGPDAPGPFGLPAPRAAGDDIAPSRGGQDTVPDCGRCYDTGMVDEVIPPPGDLTVEQTRELVAAFEAAAAAAAAGGDTSSATRAGVAELAARLGGSRHQGRCSCKRGQDQELQARTRQLLGGVADPRQVLVQLMPVARALYCVWASHQLGEDAPFRAQRQARAEEEAQILLRGVDLWLRDVLAMSWRFELQRYTRPGEDGGR